MERSDASSLPDTELPCGVRGYRLRREADQVYARVSGGGHFAALRHLSPEDLGLAWCESATPGVGHTMELDLHAGRVATGPLVAAVDRVVRAPHSGETELSLRLVAPPLAGGLLIASLMEELLAVGIAQPAETHAAVRETISDGDSIRELAISLSRDRASAKLLCPSALPTRLRAVAYLSHPDRLVWEADGPLPQAPFIIEGERPNSIFRLPIEEAALDGNLLVTLLPPEMLRLRYRWRRRVAAAPGSMIEFAHPIYPQVRIYRSLRDVSYEGLSFQTNPRGDLVYPGLVIPVMKLVQPGRPALFLSGEVRSLPERDDGRVCGMRLQLSDDRDRRAWASVVNEVLHPHTRTGSSYSADTWSLFEASGYLNLSGKDARHFESARKSFFLTGQKLDGREDLGYRAVWPSERGVEASLSLLKVYTHSWMWHQLARRPGSPPNGGRKQVLRDIFLRACEPLQDDPSCRFCFAYCDANVRWVQAAHTFALEYESTDRALSLPFRLMEAQSDPNAWSRVASAGLREGPSSDEEIECGPATEEEHELLLASLPRLRPAIYREVLDLVPSRFPFRFQSGASSTAIEREVLVARQGGRPIAAAVVEMGEPGSNLFNLLDGVKLFPLGKASAAEFDASEGPLLAAAARHFAGRNRAHFVYFNETGRMPASSLPLSDLGAGLFWVISASLLPAYLDDVHRLTGGDS